MDLGIEENGFLVYQGESHLGHGIWPQPLIYPATIVSNKENRLKAIKYSILYDIDYLFIEDRFDPISRVRCGRFYKKSKEQPILWHVYPHPIRPNEMEMTNQHGVIPKRLTTFYSFSFWQEIMNALKEQPIILLGSSEQYTIWTIINIERMANREEIVWLKSRQSIGALPRLLDGRIPELRRATIKEKLEILNDDIYNAGPESVIDRARDAASAILGAYAELEKLGRFDLDLNDLIKKIGSAEEGKRRRIIENAADIVRIFHARVKPSEQERRKTRKIIEQDAELAINCIGTILCELGWGKWL